MRLLRIENNGKLSLTEFTDDSIPPYAILSHTRGREEVTFKDMVEEPDQSKTKAGYSKIHFCAGQAIIKGLRYFWVDSCCIDRTSSAELSEAVNSMFRWYRDAAECFVLLNDVPTMYVPGREAMKEHFLHSRWFWRCWTLQELIAPKYVEFFSTDGHQLGTKHSLTQEIHEITGIPIEALLGAPLSQYSIEERMSWAERRETTLAEDRAYSLLGIFNVHMPLIYGEGGEEAFERLKRAIMISEEKTLVDESRFGAESREDLKMDIHRISTVNNTVAETGEGSDTGSDSGSDVPSIFSDGGISTSSASTAGLNPVQTTGIREISRALLSRQDLEALYTTAVHNVERRKARTHLRGFLREYGQNLLKEASDKSLEMQAAKFVQELAGRIADEISWSITGFQETSRPLDTESSKKSLENWLSSLQPQSGDVEEEPDLSARVDDLFHEAEYEEPNSDLLFPNMDKVEDFLLNSEAYENHVAAMRNWLKIGEGDSRDIGKPARNALVSTATEEVAHEPLKESNSPRPDHTSEEHDRQPTAKVEIGSQQVTAHNMKSTFRSRQNRGNLRELISGLLDFWGVSFFFYDLVELLVPRVPHGYKRLRWRCSCNTVLWGDFPIDDESVLNQLKQDLSWWQFPFTRQASSGGAEHLQTNTNSRHSLRLVGMRSPSSSDPNPTNVSDPARSGSSHIVNVTFSPKYFEVCINIGNYAIDHHEIDISRVSSDGELFELIWDKYNSSRGFGLRRFFLRPRDVHFVMFSVSRRNQYGAGIHKKPDEFPPQKELDKNRYHYLCPQVRMPVNVFLHYLHRARWDIWGEHPDDTWLQRLPKKLNDSVLAEWRQDHVMAQQNEGEAIEDSNLAFGWGVHILDGPNHAVLGILLAVGVAVAFVVSGMIVGFAETQEQGFAVGSFLLAILASIMTAVYFQLQDQ